MGYCSKVAAAIGGKPEAVQKFAKDVKLLKLSDECGILDRFQTITIENDFAVFAVYFDWWKWYEEEQEIWKTLTQLAEKAQLGNIFYRAGEDENDVEILSNSHLPDFDRRLFQIFSIQSSIVGQYSELAALDINIS